MTVINCIYDTTAHYYLSIKNTLFIHTVINVSISSSRTKYFNFKLLSHLHTNYIKKNNSLAELLMKVIKNKSTLLSLRTIVSWLFTIWHLLICFPLIQCYSVCIILHEQNMSVSLWYYLQLKHNIILVQYVDPAETIPPKLKAST